MVDILHRALCELSKIPVRIDRLLKIRRKNKSKLNEEKFNENFNDEKFNEKLNEEEFNENFNKENFSAKFSASTGKTTNLTKKSCNEKQHQILFCSRSTTKWRI